MLIESPATAAACVGILFACLYGLYIKFTAPPEVPAGLPWIGTEGLMFFSRLRGRIGTVINMHGLIDQGYQKFSKKGLNYVLPSFAGSQVILPASEIKWIAEQPESALSSTEAQRNELQTEYSFLDTTIAKHPVYYNIIKGTLQKEMDALIPEIVDEIEASVNQYFGVNTEDWTDFPVFDGMMKIISRATNRVMVGLPVCRNEEYLVNAANFAGDVIISATFIRLIPSFLRPFFAWIFLIPSRLHVYRCSKHLRPLINERLANFNASEGKESSDMPLDLMSWTIKEAAKSSDPKEQSSERLVLRLMVLNFASIHTSTFAATQMLFDLFSSPHASEYVAEIREEIEEVLKENGGEWSKAAVSKLVKTDSAIRESLRISTFLAHGMGRLVIGPNGVTTNNGLHLPSGTRLGTSTCSIHHDDDVYSDAMTYQAFRFCQPEASSLPIVTTSDKFLAFGHGRHACPGRFFAAVELKLLMAYILMNYDVKPLETRPKNFVMSATILPPMKAAIEVRRRKV